MESGSPLPREVLDRARRLHQMFLAGDVPGPERHEVHPHLAHGSRENILYFTLPVALNFQRSSPALWQSALNTWDDPETRYLYFPEQVHEASPLRVQEDLRRYGLAIQTNRHPAIWTTLCDTFHRHYHDDPRQFLVGYDYDVPVIIHALQREKKPLFPYLGGLKLSNYWLFILSQFTDISFQRPHDLSIIPDTHVVKSTIALGLLSGTPTAREVEDVWRPALRELDIPPDEMHSALWRWSRNGFAPQV